MEDALRDYLEYPHHRRALIRESGIDPAVVTERGYRTVKTKAELARLGFSKPQRREPALVIPMYSPAGELVTHQIRPDAPRQNGDGKAIKYETPAGSPVHLDVHPSQTERVKDASVPLWVTEGVKKADSLVSRGQCVVALQGVWCWQKDGLPLQEWEDVRLWGRSVWVIFDSDVTTNPKVQGALEGLVGFLRGRGARIGVAYLPDAPGGKQGVDDFLASGREVQDLEPFVHQSLREDLLPVGKPLSEIQPEQVEWLWPRRIPKGKITVLDGDPDNGMSVLTTDLAARVTAGLDLPDGTATEAAGAVIVSAEDGAADTIRPRFDAAGGDPTRALLLGDYEPFAIPGDILRLERAVRQVGAVLVVIDPIMAFLSGDVNSNRDQDVRRALTPLKQMAERTGAAVILVRHLNKTQGGNPLYRGGGSIGIIGAARSGMVVGPHPDSDELRVLAGQKNNLSLPPRSLVYGIETAHNGAARIAYKGFSEATAAQLLRVPEDEEEKSALAEAKEFLTSELARTPVTAKAIKKSAREAEISERTLRRAKQVLGVKSEKEGDGSWTWSLPDKEPEGGHVP
ncbi:MAG: AAA family ATPase, partial [Rubrobacteraceae bacterium]|nr:AAA family ATPase [Rubrobacteraceae bacterium]